MKKFLIFFNLFLLYFCFIEKSEYIKDISSSKNLEKELINDDKSTGMLLIYSSWCHHCKEFSKTYVKLSEQFHNRLFFYAMSERTDYEKKFSEVYGYPTIYFYKNGNFSKNRGSRSYDSLLKKINEEYVLKCLQINYKEIENIYNNEYLNKDISRNLLIGFFKNKENINLYDTITSDYLKNFIDFCYYCSDYEQYINNTNNTNNMNINENTILSYNKQKGNNFFYLNDINPYIKSDYILYIHNNVINSYEDINNDNKLIFLNSIKDKYYIIFVYNNTEQKQDYVEIANRLFNMNSRKGKNIFNYILLNKEVKYNKFNELKENNIYLIDKKFKKIIELSNLEYIEEIIKKNNMNLKKEIETDINYIFNNSQIIFLDSYYNYKYLFLLFITILGIYFLYKIFKKYINIGKNSIYTELMKKSNKEMKIEIV